MASFSNSEFHVFFCSHCRAHNSSKVISSSAFPSRYVSTPSVSLGLSWAEQIHTLFVFLEFMASPACCRHTAFCWKVWDKSGANPEPRVAWWSQFNLLASLNLVFSTESKLQATKTWATANSPAVLLLRFQTQEKDWRCARYDRSFLHFCLWC